MVIKNSDLSLFVENYGNRNNKFLNLAKSMFIFAHTKPKY